MTEPIRETSPSENGSIGKERLMELLNHPDVWMDDDMRIMANARCIRPNPDQPRTVFKEDRLADHRESIRSVGQIEPVVLVPYPGDDHDIIGMIKDGERTWRVCKDLDAPVYISFGKKPKDKNELFEQALVANFDQERHTINETINAIRRLKDEHGRSFEEIAKMLATGSAGTARNYYVLGDLHPDLRPLLEADEAQKVNEPALNRTVALQLIRLPEDEKERQVEVWKEVKKLDGRQAVRRAKDMVEGAGARTGKPRDMTDNRRFLHSLLERIIPDMEFAMGGIPDDHIAGFVTKLREAGRLVYVKRMLEHIYQTAAYLFLRIHIEEIRQAKGDEVANKTFRDAVKTMSLPEKWKKFQY